MVSLTPQETYTQLLQEKVLLSWKKAHPKGYLSHFFVPWNAQGERKGGWEVGFYDPQDEKMTVFVELGDDSQAYMEKPEEEVFKKPEDAVEPLDLQQISISLETAWDICKNTLQESFPHELAGDGFLILQHWRGIPLWNFTLLCKSLSFVNVKVHALSGAIQEKQLVQVITK